jgi:gamma-glutamylcyclotransferase (GGCT)/AIG2-like uncharacterized protein YtfP
MISSPRAKRDSLLFVYGTLRPFADISMARWLEHVATYAGEARTRGRLYDLGNYPGLIDAACRADWVSGELYVLRTRAVVLRLLDRYEGSQGRGGQRFVRVRRIVQPLDDRYGVKRPRVAWLYCYRRSTLLRQRIESGDYRRYVASRRTATAEQK